MREINSEEPASEDGWSVQDVQQQIEEAKKSKEPPIEDLWNNIYLDPLVAILPILIHSRHLQLSQDRTISPRVSHIGRCAAQPRVDKGHLVFSCI